LSRYFYSKDFESLLLERMFLSKRKRKKIKIKITEFEKSSSQKTPEIPIYLLINQAYKSI
tara:strand:- start:242 stop:421 length:180 start_codon:yes stop_codon:yes gene_type:complete